MAREVEVAQWENLRACIYVLHPRHQRCLRLRGAGIGASSSTSSSPRSFPRIVAMALPCPAVASVTASRNALLVASAEMPPKDLAMFVTL